MSLRHTTDEILDAIPRFSGWRRGQLIAALSFTSGALPPIALLEEAALRGDTAAEREPAIYTLRNRFGADGLATYVRALNDRSVPVQVLAAAALGETGDASVSEEFFAWARKRFGNSRRLNSAEWGELIALLEFASRTGLLTDAASLLRRYRHNLTEDEVSALERLAPGFLALENAKAPDVTQLRLLMAPSELFAQAISDARARTLDASLDEILRNHAKRPGQ